MRPVKRIEIQSSRPLSEAERKMIQDIFQESDCPFESLRNSVEGTTSFDGYLLQIGTGGGYSYHLEV